MVYGDSVSGTVSAGAIAVCNAGGCLDVTHGLSYYIKDETTKPIFINTPALLSPRQPVVASEFSRDKVAEGETAPGRKESSKGRRGDDVSPLSEDDGRRQRGQQSLPKTNDDNEQRGKQEAFLQFQADNALSASPLADVRNQSENRILGRSNFDKSKHSKN